MLGQVFCLRNVVLEVVKLLEVRLSGSVQRVRGVSYVYAAWVQGGSSLLRYHNVHQNDNDYHHRVFNWRTGDEVLYETLQRSQFPTLVEVLDEMEAVVAAYE